MIGYARVSTKGHLLDLQILALKAAGCARIYSDKKSGQNAEREELVNAFDCLWEGDTLVVPSLDRLGRSIQDLIVIVAGLRKHGIGFTSPHEALDTTTPGDRFVFHVFAALAEFIRELIVQGTNEGLDAARARGARLGQPSAMTDQQVRHARRLLTQPENTVASIARLLGVSPGTDSPCTTARPRPAPPMTIYTKTITRLHELDGAQPVPGPKARTSPAGASCPTPAPRSPSTRCRSASRYGAGENNARPSTKYTVSRAGNSRLRCSAPQGLSAL